MMMEQKTTRVGRQAPDPYREPEGTSNDDGTECQKSRETSPEPGMMMEQNAKRVIRETIPGTLPGTRRNREMMMEQSLLLGRIENPIQLQSCLGKYK